MTFRGIQQFELLISDKGLSDGKESLQEISDNQGGYTKRLREVMVDAISKQLRNLYKITFRWDSPANFIIQIRLPNEYTTITPVYCPNYSLMPIME